MTVFCKQCDQIVVAVFGVERDYALWVCPGCEAETSQNRKSEMAQKSSVGKSGQQPQFGPSAH